MDKRQLRTLISVIQGGLTVGDSLIAEGDIQGATGAILEAYSRLWTVYKELKLTATQGARV